MGGGVILNYFKIKKRRDTLYFGEIPAKYILLCEKKGFGSELREIGQKWMYLYFSTLIPETFKKIPPEDLLNEIIKRIWINMGVMGDYSIKREGNTLTIETKDEGMTELIGKNSFLLGFHEGVINALYGKEVEIIDARQTKSKCRYRFRLLDKKFVIKGKGKKEYDKLNHIPDVKGLTLNEMLKRKIFRLKGHELYFRGKKLYSIENTIMHLFGNRGLILESVPKISYEFFKGILDRKSTEEDKLRLLKNILQAMGWGFLSMTKGENSLKMKIENPPYGLQPEKENWGFLVKMIEGYLKNIDKKYKVDRVNEGYKLLTIDFSK